MHLGAVQRLAGDYGSATASSQQAIKLCRNLRDLRSPAYALNELGLVQQLTGDYPAAADSYQRALALKRDVGNRLGQAETLNCLGELTSRIADGAAPATTTPRRWPSPATSAPAQKKRGPLEGIGHSHLRDGRPSEATVSMEQARVIYQCIAAPAARRVEESLHQLRQDNLAPER